MLEYLVTDSAVVAFVLRSDRIQALSLPISKRALAGRVELARRALESPGHDDWSTRLHSLHEELVAPLVRRGLLRGADRLVIAAHGVLHYLPFGALMPTEPIGDAAPRFLMQDFVIEYTPSAAAWAIPRRESTGTGGALALAPVPRELPASVHELASVATGSRGEVRRLSGARATEAAFRRAAPEQRVLHLATFGHLNSSNPLFSHLQLGAGGGEDGRLEVHEIFAMRLAADLVVLSACRYRHGRTGR
jgi:CHAT domain-containing protein